MKAQKKALASGWPSGGMAKENARLWNFIGVIGGHIFIVAAGIGAGLKRPPRCGLRTLIVSPILVGANTVSYFCCCR